MIILGFYVPTARTPYVTPEPKISFVRSWRQLNR